jgi:integrase
MGRIYQRKQVWWVQYSANGRRRRESSGSTVKRDAVRLLKRRLAENRRPSVGTVRFEELANAIRRDYRLNGRATAGKLELRIDHLAEAFGGWPVRKINAAVIQQYADDRLSDGAANATVNRELAALRRMFRLGSMLGMVDSVPTIPRLEERNARKGFFEESDLAAILPHLTDELRPLVVVAYVTGWRRGELLSRDWRHCDFAGGVLRLEPNESKNREGREFPLIPRLRDVLEAHAAKRLELEKRTGGVVVPLFFRYGGAKAGQRIKEFRGAWDAAFDLAEISPRLFHDLRRTAVRNMVRSGIPQSVAMKLSGHKTAEVFRRYAITDSKQLRQEAAKLETLYSEPVTRTVLPMKGHKRGTIDDG